MTEPEIDSQKLMNYQLVVVASELERRQARIKHSWVDFSCALKTGDQCAHIKYGMTRQRYLREWSRASPDDLNCRPWELKPFLRFTLTHFTPAIATRRDGLPLVSPFGMPSPQRTNRKFILPKPNRSYIQPTLMCESSINSITDNEMFLQPSDMQPVIQANANRSRLQPNGVIKRAKNTTNKINNHNELSQHSKWFKKKCHNANILELPKIDPTCETSCIPTTLHMYEVRCKPEVESNYELKVNPNREPRYELWHTPKVGPKYELWCDGKLIPVKVSQHPSKKSKDGISAYFAAPEPITLPKCNWIFESTAESKPNGPHLASFITPFNPVEIPEVFESAAEPRPDGSPLISGYVNIKPPDNMKPHRHHVSVGTQPSTTENPKKILCDKGTMVEFSPQNGHLHFLGMLVEKINLLRVDCQESVKMDILNYIHGKFLVSQQAVEKA